MNDYDLPDLPSDDELGITEEDIKALEEGRSSGGGAPPPGGSEPPRGPDGPPAGGTTGDGAGDGARPTATPPAEAGPPPMGGLRGPLTLLVLLAVALVSTQWWATPSPVPANAPDTAFSSARAMGHLVEIAARAHPPGSPEHDRVRTYLVEELEDLGLEPEVQTATSMIRGRTGVRAATVRNVLARIPGTDPSGGVLLTAHYDGREISRAAADDGFGVVTILETVRALLEGPAPRNDILILLTDGEELGLLGARAFVDRSPWLEEVDVALSFEMRGGGGAAIMFETGADNGWIVRRYAEHSAAPFASSMAYEIYRRMPNDTDFTPLKGAGVQGLNLAALGQAHVYHQAWDEPGNVSEATLQHHGLQALSLTRALAAEDLTAVDAPDVAYFTAPVVGLVVYERFVVWVAGAGVLVLFLLVLLLGRRRGAGWGGMGAGLLLTLVVGGAAWLVGSWLPGWLSGFHPERGSLHGSLFHSEGWYLLSLAAAVLALALALLGLARRRFSLGGLTLGAAAVPALGALAATALAPMAAMHFQWPAIAALVAAAASTGTGARGRLGWGAWLVALLMAIPVLVSMVFVVEAAWLALNIGQAAMLGVLLTLTAALLLPALDALREPNAWWAPVAGVVAAAAFLGMGILQSRPSPERPLPTTLTYALDRETGDSRWLTQAPFEEDASQADPARTWAVERAGAAFAETRELAWTIGSLPPLPAAPAPVVEAAQPQLSVAMDSTVEGERRVRLALRSGIGAEMMLVEIPEEAGLVSVNGRALPAPAQAGEGPERVARLEHWGRPVDAVVLELRVPPGLETLTLPVVEHLLRPEELLGEEPWRRPPDMAPNVVRDSDRAMIRTPLRVALTPGAVATPAPAGAASGAPVDDTLPPPAGPSADSLPAGDTAGARPDTAPPPPDTTRAGGAGAPAGAGEGGGGAPGAGRSPSGA